MKIKGLTVAQVDHHVDAFTKLMLKGMQQVCDVAATHALTADATDGELTTTFDGLSVMATQWGEYTTGTLVPALEQLANDAAKAIATPLGSVSPIKTTQFVADMTNAISGFSDDMWKAAQTALITGVQDGASIAELASAVQDVAQVKAKKAHVIAQTSVIAAINGGEWQQMMEAAAAFDIEGVKEWEATEDAHTRPTHHEADGQRVPIDSHFVVGGSFLMFPGDPSGDPSEIISCRCTTLYDLDVDAPITASQTSPETLSTSPAVDTNGQQTEQSITAAIDAAFNAQHPRGKDGKFIKKGTGLGAGVFDALKHAKSGGLWNELSEDDKQLFVDAAEHITPAQWHNLKDEDQEHIKNLAEAGLNDGLPGSANAVMHLEDLSLVELGYDDDDTNVFDPNTPLASTPSTSSITPSAASAKGVEKDIYDAYDVGEITEQDQEDLLTVLDSQGPSAATTALEQKKQAKSSADLAAVNALNAPPTVTSLTTGQSTPTKITHGLIHAKHTSGTVIAQSDDWGSGEGVEVEWNGNAYDVIDESGEVLHSDVKKSKLYALLNSPAHGFSGTKWHSPGKQETAVSHATPLDAAPAPNVIPHPSTPTSDTSTNYPVGSIDAYANVLNGTEATLYSVNGEHKLTKYSDGGVALSSKQADGTWSAPSPTEAHTLPMGQKWTNKAGTSDTPSLSTTTTTGVFFKWGSKKYPPGHIIAGGKDGNGDIWYAKMPASAAQDKYIHITQAGGANSKFLTPSEFSEFAANQGITKWTLAPNVNDTVNPISHPLTNAPSTNKVAMSDVVVGDKLISNGYIPYAIVNGKIATVGKIEILDDVIPGKKWIRLLDENGDIIAGGSEDHIVHHAPSLDVTPSPDIAPLASFTPFDEDSAVTDMADVTGLPDEKAVQVKVLLHQFNKGMMTKQEFADQVNLVHTGPVSSAPVTPTPSSVPTPTPTPTPTPSASTTPVTINDLNYLQKTMFYTHFKAEKVSPAWSGAKIYKSIHAAKLKMSGDPKIAALSDSEMLKLIDEMHYHAHGSGFGSVQPVYSDKVKEWLKTPNGQKAFKQLNPAIPTVSPTIATKVTKAAKFAKKTAATVNTETIADALGDTTIDPLADNAKIYSTFKSANYGKYLNDPAEHIYWNAVKQSKTVANSTPGSILATIDAEGAKKFGVPNEKKFTEKVTKWLKTPSGKTKAAEIKAGAYSPGFANPATSSHSSSGIGSSTSYAHPANTPLNDKIPPLNTSVEDFDSSKAYNWKKDSPDFPVVNHAKAQQMVNAWSAQQGAITSTQKSALRKYTGNAYYSMNGYLRGYSGASAQTHKDVQNAQAGMRLSTEPIVLHRGNDWFGGWTSVAEVKSHLGEDFHQEAFFSSSIGGKSAFSGPINFVIECPTGTPMQYVKTFSQYGGEDEMLLAGNLTYRVVEVIEGNKAPDGSQHYNTKVTVRLRVIPPSENQISYGSSS